VATPPLEDYISKYSFNRSLVVGILAVAVVVYVGGGEDREGIRRSTGLLNAFSPSADTILLAHLVAIV
jgi:DhnA family fructose-bisphosphate aldolase class Ia